MMRHKPRSTSTGEAAGKLPLGPPDVFPQEGNQAEDDLSKEHCLKGFQPRFAVPLETERKSALENQRFLEQFESTDQLTKFIQGISRDLNKSLELQSKVNNLMTDIVSDPAEKTNMKPAPRFSKEKQERWMEDLADAKPLKDLKTTVPFYNKKVELLERLCEKNVPLHRATWFVTVTIRHALKDGKNSKTKPATELTQWQKAIADFVDSKLKEKSSKNRDYILRLARVLFDEGLLERQSWIEWLIKGLKHFSAHRSLFMALVGQYIDDIAASRDVTLKLYVCLCQLGLDILKHKSGSSTTSPRSMGSVEESSALLDSIRYLVCWIHDQCADACVGADSKVLDDALALLENSSTPASLIEIIRDIRKRHVIVAELQQREPYDVVLLAKVLDMLDPLYDSVHPCDRLPKFCKKGLPTNHSSSTLVNRAGIPNVLLVTQCSIEWTVAQHRQLTPSIRVVLVAAFLKGFLQCGISGDELRKSLVHEIAHKLRESKDVKVMSLLLGEFGRTGVLPFEWISDRITLQGGCNSKTLSDEMVVYGYCPFWRSFASVDNFRLRGSLLYGVTGTVPDSSKILSRALIPNYISDNQLARECVLQLNLWHETAMTSDENPTTKNLCDSLRQLPLHVSAQLSFWMSTKIKKLSDTLLEFSNDEGGNKLARAYTRDLLALYCSIGDIPGLLKTISTLLDAKVVFNVVGDILLQYIVRYVSLISFGADRDLASGMVKMLSAHMSGIWCTQARSALFALLSHHRDDSLNVLYESVSNFAKYDKILDSNAVNRLPKSSADSAAAVMNLSSKLLSGKSENGSKIFLTICIALISHFRDPSNTHILPAITQSIIDQPEFRAAVVVALTEAFSTASAKEDTMQSTVQVILEASWLSHADLIGCIVPRRLERKKIAISPTISLLAGALHFVTCESGTFIGTTTVHKSILGCVNHVVKQPVALEALTSIFDKVYFSTPFFEQCTVKKSTSAKSTGNMSLPPQLRSLISDNPKLQPNFSIDSKMKQSLNEVIVSTLCCISASSFRRCVLQLKLLLQDFNSSHKPRINIVYNLISGHLIKQFAIVTSAFEFSLYCGLLSEMDETIRVLVLENVTDSIHDPEAEWWNVKLDRALVESGNKLLSKNGIEVDQGQRELLSSSKEIAQMRLSVMLKMISICLRGQDVKVNRKMWTKLHNGLTTLCDKIKDVTASENILLCIEFRVKLVLLNAAAIWSDTRDNKKVIQEFCITCLKLILAINAVSVPHLHCYKTHLCTLLCDTLHLLVRETPASVDIFEPSSTATLSLSKKAESVLSSMDRQLRLRCERLLPGSLNRRYRAELVRWEPIGSEHVPFCLESINLMPKDGTCFGECNKSRIPSVAAAKANVPPGGSLKQTLELLESGATSGAGISWVWFDTSLRERRKDIYFERIQHTRSLRHLRAPAIGGGGEAVVKAETDDDLNPAKRRKIMNSS